MILEWTIKNDTQSVHVGINTRIWLCRQHNTLPDKILLGKYHSELYMNECGWNHLPANHLYNNKIPVEFNTPGIYGIVMIEKEKTPK